jgi:hypothetical protein
MSMGTDTHPTFQQVISKIQKRRSGGYVMPYLESHNEQNDSSNSQQAADKVDLADDLALRRTLAVDARWREVEEERRHTANKDQNRPTYRQIE